jgi:hypothetical protein
MHSLGLNPLAINENEFIDIHINRSERPEGYSGRIHRQEGTFGTIS